MKLIKIPSRILELFITWLVMVTILFAIMPFFPEYRALVLSAIAIISFINVACMVLNWRMRNVFKEQHEAIKSGLKKG